MDCSSLHVQLSLLFLMLHRCLVSNLERQGIRYKAKGMDRLQHYSLVHRAKWCFFFTGLRRWEDTIVGSVQVHITGVSVGQTLTRNSMKPSVFPACRGRAVGMISWRLSIPSSLIRNEVFVECCKAFDACAMNLNR